jgi:phospholipid/cholesterol/gamma-HCH transport system substrate-binding protein
MAKIRSWRDLVSGLIALAAVIAAALGVLLFARVGAMHGDKVRLFARTARAAGIMKGSEVWLAGQRIGKVASIAFAPPKADTLERVILVMDVLDEYLPQLRRDTDARIRAGGTLIGAQVVYLSPGSAAAPQLHAGDTIPAHPQEDFEGVTSQIAIASHQFPAIIENVKLINQQLDMARGTIGMLGMDEGSSSLQAFRANAASLNRVMTSSNGSIGRALGDGGLMVRAQQTIARADSVRRLLSEGNGNFGRFQRDSTLLRTVAGVRDDVSIVRALLAEARGTAGRTTSDRAIALQLSRTQQQMDSLFADIKEHPFRYIAF